VNNRRARSTMTLEYNSRRKPQLATFAPLAACVMSEATAFALDIMTIPLYDGFRGSPAISMILGQNDIGGARFKFINPMQ